MTSVPPWFAVFALGAAACTEAGPTPQLLRVDPAQGFSDRDERMSLLGDSFVPSYHVAAGDRRRVAHASGFTGRVVSDAAAVVLKDFGWVSQVEVTATLAQGLPAGIYAIELTDPRGRTTILSDAFVSLGPDRLAPELNFESPDPQRPFAKGVVVDAQLVVSDGPGYLNTVEWSANVAGATFAIGACAVPVRAHDLTCRFTMTVPANSHENDELRLVATASDGATPPNISEETIVARLRASPFTQGIFPRLGGTAGGTEVVITGDGFLPGTQVLVDDVPLIPAGGIRLDDRTMTGRTPRHRPGPGTFVVRTPIGDATVPGPFDFQPPPEVFVVAPSAGPAAGGAPVQILGQRFSENTVILFGPSLVSATALLSQRFVGPTEIIGRVPAGTGATAIWAFDAATGFTHLAEAFLYLP